MPSKHTVTAEEITEYVTNYDLMIASAPNSSNGGRKRLHLIGGVYQVYDTQVLKTQPVFLTSSLEAAVKRYNIL